MLPISLDPEIPENVRARYKVIRLDLMEDACPGALILAAYVESGACTFRKKDGSNEAFSFGSGGLKIIPI